jgi:chemotaxis protein histidine kinase CheA
VDSANQQRILGYFIEEAKEHLDTLEQGLLSLRSVVEDPERVNEMFRAAHSVKGGAAMLGFGSIQKTAHRLEDSFKILKDNDINVDQTLETLFLQGYDTLKDLIEQLQGPFGLREEDAEKTVQAAEPTFNQLQSYLNRVVNDGTPAAKAPASDGRKRVNASLSAEPPKAQDKLPPNFGSQVTEILKQMLQLFKQTETPPSRQKLQALCKRLFQLGGGIKTWQELVQVSYKAIANPRNSFQALAPVVIKELKQTSDRLQTGNTSAIAISPALQKLAAVPTTTTQATGTPVKESKQPTATTATSTKTKQITIAVEPRAAAKALVQAFDKPQLLQLVKLLAQATRTSS